MGSQTQTFRSASGQSISNEITNLSIPIANTEISHVLQLNLKQLIVKARTNGAKLKVSFVVGESGTKYVTIYPGCVLTLTDLGFSASTLYIQSSKVSTVVEILELY